MRVRVGFGVSAVVLGMLIPISGIGSRVDAETVFVRPRWPTPVALAVALSPLRLLDVAAPAVRAVPIHSSYETRTRAASRDVGISVALPDGHDLWLFGDTGIFERKGTGGWKETTFVDGSSALQTRYRRGHVPHGGEYPSKVPARFIPVPTNVYMPDGSGRLCTALNDAYPARWPTGAAVMTDNSSDVLISYSEVCVVRTPQGGVEPARAEGWGYMLYDWRTHRIVHGPTDVYEPRRDGAPLAESTTFGSPYFDNGRLTLFAFHCTSMAIWCAGGEVWSATMPATVRAMDNAASYTLHRLFPNGPRKWQPMSISVGRYGGGLRLLEMTSVGGTYQVFSAATVTDQWRFERSGRLPGCPTRTGFCYALAGHPELSTSTQTFVSYMDPDSGPGGHIVISTIPS